MPNVLKHYVNAYYFRESAAFTGPVAAVQLSISEWTIIPVYSFVCLVDAVQDLFDTRSPRYWRKNSLPTFRGELPNTDNEGILIRVPVFHHDDYELTDEAE